MSNSYLKIMQDKEVSRRILITLGIVIIYKLMTFIPIPGINIETLRDLFSKFGVTQAMPMLITGGRGLTRVTILALGLMPYLSSCVIIQLFGCFIAPLGKYYTKGEEGRQKIIRYTYYLTVGLSIIQSLFLSRWLENPSVLGGANLVQYPGWGFRLMVVFSLTGAVLLLIWLASLITKYGIGNGVAILVLSSLIYDFGVGIFQIKTMLRYQTLDSGGQLLFLILIFCASVYIIWRITSATKKIPVKYNNSLIKSSLSLRFSWSGKIPISLPFVQATLLFPATIATIYPGFNKFAQQFSRGGVLYYIAYPILIIFFTYFYIAVVFSQINIKDLMKKHNCDIDDRGNKDIPNYLDYKMTRMTIITALFLIAVVLLPQIFTRIFKLSYLVSGFISGVSLVVMMGIFYDIKSQIESYFKRKEHPQVDNWEVGYVVLTEIEAEIKKGYLETHGIDCVIEPLRFTWGMPMGTTIDQYKLYVPANFLQKTKELLTD